MSLKPLFLSLGIHAALISWGTLNTETEAHSPQITVQTWSKPQKRTARTGRIDVAPTQAAQQLIQEAPALQTNPQGTPTVSPSEVDQFLGNLREQIARELIYPWSLRRKGVQGKVVVNYLPGHSPEIRIQESSQVPELDEAALQAVSKAVQSLPWKSDSTHETPELLIPVDFRLR